MSEIGNFFQALPLFTRYWFGLSIFFPLISRFGLLSPAYLILEYSAFIRHFQIWRPLTAVFFYPLGPATAFAYLLNLYFLYNYSVRLETGVYDGRPADYFFLLLFNWITIVIIALFSNTYSTNYESKAMLCRAGPKLLMDPMILSVLYIWCQINKDVIVSFWFGTRFKAVYLPWVLFGFNFILRGGGFDELIGILVGHMYYFLKYKYPQEHRGPDILQTPAILHEYFPSRRGGVSGFGQAPTSRPPQNDARRRYTWGRGQVLGNS